MKRREFIGLIGAAAATPFVAHARAEPKRTWTITGHSVAQLDGLDQAMQRAMQEGNIRAATLAVTCMGQALFERAYTWAEPGYPITQPNSIFRLASVEKAFIVALTYELVRSGAFTLDSRVFPILDLYHLARKGRRIDPQLNDITVKHLIQNRSGLPRHVPNAREMARALGLRRPPTSREALGYMLTEPLLFTPGTKEQYSSLGHDVLLNVCAKAAGMDYFSALRKYVKGPRWDVEAFPYTKEYSRHFRKLPRDVLYDDPRRGVTLLDPYGTELLPYAYGGDVIFLEGEPAVLATAAAVARLIGNYAAWGYGPRNVSGRDGAQPGSRCWTQARRDRLDFCFIFNTSHYGDREDPFSLLRAEINRVLDDSHIGCEVAVYAEENFAGRPWRSHNDERRLPDGYNDRVSSIQILSGNWEFFEHFNFNGKALKLGPGEHRLEGDWRGIISSLRCVEPTLARDAGPCTRLTFRQTADMCNNCTAPPWNGELTKASGDEWALSYVDGNKKTGAARWRLASANRAEMIFVDDGRNLFTRFDLLARKGFQRRGQGGAWSSISEVLSVQCE